MKHFIKGLHGDGRVFACPNIDQRNGPFEVGHEPLSKGLFQYEPGQIFSKRKGLVEQDPITVQQSHSLKTSTSVLGNV